MTSARHDSKVKTINYGGGMEVMLLEYPERIGEDIS